VLKKVIFVSLNIMVVNFPNKRLTYALNPMTFISKILLQVLYLANCKLWILSGYLDVKKCRGINKHRTGCPHFYV